MRRLMFSAMLLALVGLTGCEGLVSPQELQVEIVQINLGDDGAGNCEVHFVAQGFGSGVAFMDRVTVLRGETVVLDLQGAETASFWGSHELRAGQTLTSQLVSVPPEPEPFLIQLSVRSGRSRSTSSTRPACGSPT